MYLKKKKQEVAIIYLPADLQKGFQLLHRRVGSFVDHIFFLELRLCMPLKKNRKIEK